MKTDLVNKNSKNFSSLASNAVSRVKGFNDYVGEDALKRAEIKKILVGTFEKYGFEPVETPVVEYEEFVKGDNDKDESVSDIFKLKDKGNRDLALRYEFTFQLKRLMNNKKLPFRRYQIGEVFRDEPVSGNRFRQFVQCDVDVVGSTVKDEAEILSMASEVLKNLGIDFKIYFNNRKIMVDYIRILFGFEDKNSINELIRYFDKLDKQKPSEIIAEIEKNNNISSAQKFITKKQLSGVFLPLLSTLRNSNLEQLKEYYIGILKNRGREGDYENSLFNEGYKEAKELINLAKDYGTKLEFLGYLARGLSYYNGTVYEIKTSKMKENINAGGSYEFNGVQCTGISFGLDRLSFLAKVKKSWNSVLIISLDEDKQAIDIAKKLRDLDNRVSIFYGKPSKALEFADSYNYNQVIFVGAKEIQQKKIKVKDMETGKEKMVLIEKINKKNLIFQRK